MEDIKTWTGYSTDIKKKLLDLSAAQRELQAQIDANKKKVGIEKNHLKAVNKRLACLQKKFNAMVNS